MLHGIDLSRFKVIHGEKVLRAVALSDIEFSDNIDFSSSSIIKPKFLNILVINSEGNMEILHDEAWTFQFVPEVRDSER